MIDDDMNSHVLRFGESWSLSAEQQHSSRVDPAAQWLPESLTDSLETGKDTVGRNPVSCGKLCLIKEPCQQKHIFCPFEYT